MYAAQHTLARREHALGVVRLARPCSEREPLHNGLGTVASAVEGRPVRWRSGGPADPWGAAPRFVTPPNRRMGQRGDGSLPPSPVYAASPPPLPAPPPRPAAPLSGLWPKGQKRCLRRAMGLAPSSKSEPLLLEELSPKARGLW